MRTQSFLRLSGLRPGNFHGSVNLPPSKSYMHRALFVSSLCTTKSTIENLLSHNLSEDIKATMNALRSFGIEVQSAQKGKSGSALIVHPASVRSSRKEIFVGGSGTAARFAIAFAAIPSDGGRTIINGDSSLIKRPMQPLIDALIQLGVKCYSKKSKGRLPVLVEANGINGGNLRVDGSISSQFISALLIACTQAKKDTILKIINPSDAVSQPYIEATQFVLKFFGFCIESKKTTDSICFYIKGNQKKVMGKNYSVPGDMSSAAALIGAALTARGKVKLDGINPKMPQADSAFLSIARMFGASVLQRERSVIVSARERNEGSDQSKSSLIFNLKDSPDIAPIVAGVAAGLGREVKIRNIGHLRFKESDRLSTLSKEMSKIGIGIVENKDSLSISSSKNADQKMNKKNKEKNYTILSSERDHRILMALTIAGLSGRFGELLISDPSCINKSYPSFITDLKSLTRGKVKTLSIVVKE